MRVVDQLLLALIIYVSEDVVENEVAGGLLGQDEGLDKLLELSGLVGCFADNLDDDVVVGSLGIDVGDADLTILEVEQLNPLLNGLSSLD